MLSDTFQTIIENDYENIKRNFRCAGYKINITFDEDVFNDTFIKCIETLDKKDLDAKSVIQYFWVAYVNNVRKNFRVSKYTPKLRELKQEDESIIDYEYDDSKYELYDIIINSVTNRFGENNTNIWKLHFVDNKSYNDLFEMGYNEINFHNLFRQINFYIKNILPKENERAKILLCGVLGTKKNR